MARCERTRYMNILLALFCLALGAKTEECRVVDPNLQSTKSLVSAFQTGGVATAVILTGILLIL